MGRPGRRRRLQPVRGPGGRGRRTKGARPGLDHPGGTGQGDRRRLRPAPAPRPEIAAILSAPLPEAALAASAERASEAQAAAAANGASAPPEESTDTDRPGHGGRGVPTPKDLAGSLRGPGAQPDRHLPQPSAANATLRWSSDKSWAERGGPLGEPAETASLPTLAQLTSAEQRWADREEDITTVGGDPFEVGQVFARRWMERLPETVHLQKLSTMYPRIPHRIDGELLRYAARFGLLAHKDDQIDEHDRYAIRAGFWREIDVRAAAEHTPAAERTTPSAG